MTIVAVALFVVLLTALYVWAVSKKKQLEVGYATPPFEGIPLAPGAHWLFGHILEMGNGFDTFQKKVLVDSADENGVTSFWMVNRAAVSTLLAKDVKAVLNASSFREDIPLLKIHNDVFLGPHALTALMGKDWKYYRNVVHRSFTPAALKGTQSAVNTVARTLCESLLQKVSKKTTTSFQATVLPLMRMATMDVFVLMSFGVDLACCSKLQSSPIARAFDFLTSEYSRRLDRIWDPTASMYWLPTTANRRHRQERTLIRSFLTDLVTAKRMELEAGTCQTVDLLTSLLKANLEKGGDMSNEVLTDILITLLFGGYDTTSITLAYTLYLLGSNAAAQEECVQEIKAVLGDAGSVQDPTDLPFTRAVILETLRLYPAAPVTVRNLEKPLELHGNVLPKNTMMYVPIWSIQRDPRNFEKPGDFLPERWVMKRENKWVERDTSSGEALFAFSGGARNCVGQKLAMQESVTFLAVLLRDLKFEFVQADYKIKPTLKSFIQKPGDDLPMIIKARN